MKPDPAEWATPQARVKWLVNQQGGNRSKFAEAIGVSHTAVSQVVAGLPPGRKLLEAIARHLHISSEWLLTGTGQPTSGGKAEALGRYVPISVSLLPGPVGDNRDLLKAEFGLNLDYSPSQYWYRLDRREPLVHEARRGFLLGDLLLLETDRSRFPRKRDLFDELCAVRLPDSGQLKLAACSWERPSEDTKGGLLADTFEQDDGRPMIREEVYRTTPGGFITRTERNIPAQPSAKELSPDLAPETTTLAFTDIVAVWTRIMHRPGTTPLA